MMAEKIASNNLPDLIGLSGSFASGKDTLAHFLHDEFGFNHVSTSDMLRDITREKYGSIDRPLLAKTADELRHERGASVLVDEALAKHNRPLVVSALRSLGEAKAIKKAGGVLIFVDAPVEVRYERMKARARDEESQRSLADFKKGEENEWHAGDTDADFNLRGIRDMADAVLNNSRTPEKLQADFLQKFGRD